MAPKGVWHGVKDPNLKKALTDVRYWSLQHLKTPGPDTHRMLRQALLRLNRLLGKDYHEEV